MKKSLAYVLSCLQLLVFSQNENKLWYFGDHAGLDFTTSPPTVLTGVAINTFEGCASIANAAGNLLFYTDGVTVWNASHVPMANGTGLLGFSSSTQSAIIIKKPGSNSIYYIVTQGAGISGLNYSVVNMTLAAGAGSVTARNIHLASATSEKLTSVKHCNGTDIWLVTHSGTGNTYMSFLVTAAGINIIPVLSQVGYSYQVNDLIGCMKLSPNGRKIAAALYSSSSIELCDFDNSTGQVSNPLLLAGADYGLEFSPDGTKLYGGLYNFTTIYQWDLCAGTTTAAIVASRFTLCNSGTGKGQMQLATNGKIYIARSFQADLAVIDQPNAAGSGCSYTETGQSMAPGSSVFGLPNFITSGFRPAPLPFSATVNPVYGCQTASFSSAYHPGQPAAMGCAYSSYSLTSLLWNFGDPFSGTANTSNLNSPLHIYSNAGTYTVQLILYYSCGGGSDTLRQTVNVNTPCLSVNGAGFSCAALGSATVSCSGTGPFTYSWQPSSQTTSVANNLQPGSYTVTVYDQGANAAYTTSAVFAPSGALAFTASASSSVACAGLATGTAAVVSVSGGSGNSAYYWTNGISSFTSAAPAHIGAGQWTVTVTDALSGCIATQQFAVSQPPAITVTPQANLPHVCVNAGIALTGTATGGSPFGSGPAYSYSWNTGPGLNQVVTQNSAGTFSYTLTAVDAAGCSVSNTIALGFANRPQISVSSISVCPGQTGMLTASGAGSYLWSNGATGNSIAVSTPVNQNYTVTGQNAGCSNTAMATVYIKPAPTPLFSSNGPVCKGASLILSCSSGTAYCWSGPGSFTSAAASATLYNVTEAAGGAYQVTVTAANSCTAAVTGSVVVIVPTLTISPANPTMCISSNGVTLIASGTATLLNWQPGLNISSATNATVVARPPFTRDYTLLGSVHTCKAKAVVTVKVLAVPSPSITRSGHNHVLCAGDTITLEGHGGESYSWEYPDHTTVNGSVVNVVPPNSSYSGIYTLTASNANNCASSIGIRLRIEDPPGGYLKNSASGICVPFKESYRFIALNCSQQDVRFDSWSVNNELAVSSGDQLNYTYKEPGSYVVKTTVRSLHDCPATFSLAVNAHAAPPADFRFLPEHPVESSDLVDFLPLAEPGFDVNWYFTDNEARHHTSTFNPQRMFETAGAFPVTLVSKNEWGCSDTVTRIITVEPDFSVYVPNAFTPNADGLNELFYPVTRGVQELSFSVFNRWNEEVFWGAGGWDGNYKGLPCKEDTYAWKLKAVGLNGQVRNMDGTVLLYR